ncbi:conserved hypothetical protein [Candidatus Terasakiella magnetica]|nr:conserved hypothetical protein [Candidatus Terasakiella magnetica]
MTQNNSPLPKAAALAKLVEAWIKDQPVEFDGQTWAAAPQEWWSEQLGASIPTLRRIIVNPPFVRNRAVINGTLTTLLRLGELGPLTDRDRAIHLRNIWRKKMGREVGPKAFGCLVALVKGWGEHAPTIFAIVLKNWSAFMAGVKIDPDWTKPRHLKFPNIAVIRRFHHVAVELWMMQQQEKAGNVEDVNAALNLYHSLSGLAG